MLQDFPTFVLPVKWIRREWSFKMFTGNAFKVEINGIQKHQSFENVVKDLLENWADAIQKWQNLECDPLMAHKSPLSKEQLKHAPPSRIQIVTCWINCCWWISIVGTCCVCDRICCKYASWVSRTMLAMDTCRSALDGLIASWATSEWTTEFVNDQRKI